VRFRSDERKKDAYFAPAKQQPGLAVRNRLARRALPTCQSAAQAFDLAARQNKPAQQRAIFQPGGTHEQA
jgi:hypothetical protein